MYARLKTAKLTLKKCSLEHLRGIVQIIGITCLALTSVNHGVHLQALMLKQEQEELLKEQRKLEQAVSFGYLFVCKIIISFMQSLEGYLF